MKLDKRLVVGATEVELSADEVIIELSAGGRALFTFKGSGKPGQIVAYDIGYNRDMRRWFTGIIERLQPAENGYQRAFCRELSGVLGQQYTMSIQHATLRQVIKALSQQCGLSFVLPAADYVDKPIPNFTAHGTGYQLLEAAGRAFSVPDWIWYQQTDAQVWCGSYAHSYWVDRSADIGSEWSTRRAGDSMTLPAVPAIRPGVTIDGKRITSVRMTGSEMTIGWKGTGKTADQRRMESQYPEMAAGYHLPMFGRVVMVADSASAGQVADSFRPRYAVDVQLLTEDGTEDKAVPVYKAVPLPVVIGGHDAGMFGLPEEGTIVEIGFAFGRADKPFIRTVLAQDWTLPDIKPLEQLQQQRAEVYQRMDSAGNITRATDRTITDNAYRLEHIADELRQAVGSHELVTRQHSIEQIGGSKIVEALGNIEQIAAGMIDQAALGNMRHTTAGDLTQVAGKVHRTVAGDLQHMEAPRSWLGNDSTNILHLLLELMGVVKDLANTTATHTHNGSPKPDQGPAFSGQSNEANELASTLSPMLE